MEGSYQRTRASLTLASAVSVFAWLLQATSNGPPVQRIGTHASGAGVPEAPSGHETKKSNARTNNDVLPNLDRDADPEIRLARNAQPNKWLVILVAPWRTTVPKAAGGEHAASRARNRT